MTTAPQGGSSQPFTEEYEAYRAWRAIAVECPACDLVRDAHFIADWKRCAHIERLTSENTSMKALLGELWLHDVNYGTCWTRGMRTRVQEAIHG